MKKGLQSSCLAPAVTLITLAVLSFGPHITWSRGGVRIEVGTRKAIVGEPFPVRIVNEIGKPITFCVTLDSALVTPTTGPVPDFEIRTYDQEREKWKMQIRLDCNAGDCSAPWNLKSGAEEFRIRVREVGRYCLRLYYITELPPSDGHCPLPTDNAQNYKTSWVELQAIPKK